MVRNYKTKAMRAMPSIEVIAEELRKDPKAYKEFMEVSKVLEDSYGKIRKEFWEREIKRHTKKIR